MENNAPRKDLRIPSAIFCLASYATFFFLLGRYDWDQPFVRFACLASLMAMCLLARHRASPPISKRAVHAELILGVCLTILLAERIVFLGWDDMASPPRVDVGFSTQAAVEMLFHEGKNPYRSKTIAIFGEDPRYWGYKYGPAMILGYSIGAPFSESGIKIANLAYLSLSLLAVFLLAHRDGRATAWSCCALALLPGHLWYELLHRGVIDIFPICLILLSILAVDNRAWFIAGLLAGLSLSAKFAPGAFYIALFLRRERMPRFFVGLACGLLPLIAFLMWDAGALLRNFFVFHVLFKAYDSTSLYSITPKDLHFVFPLVQVAAILLILAINYSDKIEARSLIYRLLILLLVIEMTYKEVHQNHLLWSIPLLAIHLGVNRHGLLPGFLRAARSIGRASA
jgi:hypothetical protein